MTNAASPKIAPSGGPPPGSGVQNSVPAIAPRSPPTSIGIRQSKIFVLTDSSRDLRRRRSAPSSAMRWSCHSKRPVLPDLLPARRALAVDAGRHVDAREAVVVEVVGLGVEVDLDRPVGEHARVGLVVVALDHDVLAARVVQQQPVVAVEHVDGDALASRA